MDQQPSSVQGRARRAPLHSGETRPGDTAAVQGPFGRFSYLLHPDASDLLFLCGGIGITPFLNMARNLRVNKRDDLEIDFYYATKSAGEMIFKDELVAISTECPNLRIIPYSSDQMGFLNADAVAKISGDLRDTDIFVCGPPPMMNSLAAQFAKAQIPKNLVHMEAFKLL